MERVFSLDCQAGNLKDDCGHSKSTRENAVVVRCYLEEEIGCGSMMGLFEKPPIENLHLNRINLKPKEETIDKSKPANNQYRIIVDLSSP